MRRIPRFSQLGFTLLEVLVALAVLAISLGAMIKIASASAETVAYLRDRTLASWVASNKINEILLLGEWPAPGASQGTSEMAGHDWYWEVRVSDTADPDLRRLDVEVRARDGGALVTVLTAFVGRAQ